MSQFLWKCHLEFVSSLKCQPEYDLEWNVNLNMIWNEMSTWIWFGMKCQHEYDVEGLKFKWNDNHRNPCSSIFGETMVPYQHFNHYHITLEAITDALMLFCKLEITVLLTITPLFSRWIPWSTNAEHLSAIFHFPAARRNTPIQIYQISYVWHVFATPCWRCPWCIIHRGMLLIGKNQIV